MCGVLIGSGSMMFAQLWRACGVQIPYRPHSHSGNGHTRSAHRQICKCVSVLTALDVAMCNSLLVYNVHALHVCLLQYVCVTQRPCIVVQLVWCMRNATALQHTEYEQYALHYFTIQQLLVETVY